MTVKLKEWGGFLTAGATALYALSQFLDCAKEHAQMNAAIQALAEIAFR